MTQKEAARELAISVRTLQRYTKEGRIPAGQAKGKTRSVLVYEATDVAALKALLETSPYTERTKRPTLDTETLTIRLDDHTLKQLKESGARHNLSAGQYARALILRGLETEPDGSLTGLRKELAAATFALLAYAGTLTPEQAEKWVRENLLRT